jgi:hypothetical protein
VVVPVDDPTLAVTVVEFVSSTEDTPRCILVPESVAISPKYATTLLAVVTLEIVAVPEVAVKATDPNWTLLTKELVASTTTPETVAVDVVPDLEAVTVVAFVSVHPALAVEELRVDWVVATPPKAINDLLVSTDVMVAVLVELPDPIVMTKGWTLVI